MRVKIAVVLAAVALALGGCTGSDMQAAIQASCAFKANQGDLIKLGTKIGGALIPGSVFAFETADAVVTGVCSAYTQQKTVKRESAIRGVVVKGVFVRRE